MRYAIVSDIHANLTAWEAVLADLRTLNVEEIVCLGDVVGYGPKPAEVLDAVRAVTGNFVIGNHDAATVGMMDYSIFNDDAREAIEWTMEELDDSAKEFLSSMPLAIEAGDVLFVHAEIEEPGRFDYIDGIEMALQNFKAGKHFVTFVGHTHLPKVFEMDCNGEVSELADDDVTLDPNSRYIVNVGSVGEPRNPDDLRARYGVYDTETEELVFRRVEFDIIAYRENLEATTLSMRPFFLQTYEYVVEGQEVEVSRGGSLVDMQVVHGSASLINSGEVSNMGQLIGSEQVLPGARTSRAPKIIVAVAAAVALFSGVYWAMKEPGEDAKNENVARKVEEASSGIKEGSGALAAKGEPQDNGSEEIAEPKPETVKPPAEPKPEMPKTIAAKVEPKPQPKPESKPKPTPKLKPKPAPPEPDRSLQEAWWRMDEAAENGPLVDDGNKITLDLVEKGKKMDPIAPNPIPLNQQENKSALIIGIWQEPEPSGEFLLGSRHSFTFEGWIRAGKIKQPVFLLGTRTSEGTGGRGWHLDIRPPGRGRSQGQMSFFYDSGRTTTEALAEEVQVADLKPHHFAVVWDHNHSGDSGEMRLFLDGVQVASDSLPHAGLSIKQSNPLRVGAKGNPAKLALDELRFSRRALAPHEFLLRGAVVGVRMTKSDIESHNSWLETENWEGGKLPYGDENVIIDEGVTAQAEKSLPPSFSGALVLKEKSTLVLWRDNGLSLLPKAPAKLVLYHDARLILRAGNAKFGPVELLADSEIWGGESTQGHRRERQFLAPITGPGKLILNGVNKNTFIFEAANTFSGGMKAHSTQKESFYIIVKKKGTLGVGDVTIGEGCFLTLGKETENVITSDATLSLELKEGPKVPKLTLNSNETVGGFVINGKDQGEGEFSSKTHKAIAGPGKLVVMRPK